MQPQAQFDQATLGPSDGANVEHLGHFLDGDESFREAGALVGLGYRPSAEEADAIAEQIAERLPGTTPCLTTRRLGPEAASFRER